MGSAPRRLQDIPIREYNVSMFDGDLFFDALADESRRRILTLLAREEELCVCELFHALDLPQPRVSKHLGMMREAGVLSMRREGTWIYYRLHPLMPMWAYRIVELMTQGSPASQVEADGTRLAGMPNRPVRCCG